MKLEKSMLLLNGLAAASFSQGAMMRGLLDASNFPARSQGLRAMLEECGEYLGDGSDLGLQVGDGTGRCPDNESCENFYTVGNLLKAIDEYNDGKDDGAQFPLPVRGSRCLTLAGFLGQTVYESGDYLACKEYVEPCGDPLKCSGGHASDYAPDNQGDDWGPHTTPEGYDGPPNGCTDYWGTVQSDNSHCWFGRGAIQISWLPNYLNYYPNADYYLNPDRICEDGKLGWIGSVAFWQAHHQIFDRTGGTCESATEIPNPANCDDACYRARCDSQTTFTEILVRGPTQPPSPPPPTSGEYTVPADIASEGCWGIINAVCGPTSRWQESLCSPNPLNGCPNIQVGDTIIFDCNGCPTFAPTLPPPPPSGDYTVPSDIASGGCWTIINEVCPGQGGEWAKNLCSPDPSNGCPNIQGGDTIQYNCGGCI